MSRVERRSRALLLATVLLVGLLPWTVLRWDGGFGFVFAFGLVSLDPLALVTVSDYLFRFSGGLSGLPRGLFAWPASGLLWALAAASAAGGLVLDREDRRVTGWLLVLAGVGHLSFALGQHRGEMLALPVGTVFLWTVAWVWYGSALGQVVGR